jgi:N-acetylglucosaminyldiphosphoundecaprenol N-acetyl-beta-D-mannosaminyltransferase
MRAESSFPQNEMLSASALPCAYANREIRLFGYRFHPKTKSELLDFIFADRERGTQVTIASANLHGLYIFERVAAYRELHARDGTNVIVDGMPIVWLLRLFGHEVERRHRTTWMDWFEDALDRAARTHRRVFILGHTSQALRAGLARARERWPRLAIGGADGFFDTENPVACHAVMAAVNRFSPDILFIGMGMPRQEIFAARYGCELDAPVIGLGGAAFAYFAGDQPTPPRWAGQMGLEWLCRLVKDPRRLATRYLVEPLFLLSVLSLRLFRERV